MKYKIWDKVIVKKHHAAKDVPFAATVFEIDHEPTQFPYLVKDVNGHEWWAEEKNLELVKSAKSDKPASLSEILEVQHAAVSAIDARMWGALKSGAHSEGEWKTEPVEQHACRAAKHILTAVELIRNLDRKSDETAREHVQAAVTRCAMLLANLEAGR